MATRKAITLVSGLFQEVNTPTDKLDFAGNTTADLNENTNLYFTNTRARAAVSVTDSGGFGSLSYNNSTGVITYVGTSNSDVRGILSAASGSGLTYNSSTGEFGTSAIPNSQLANDDVTIGSTAVALGATASTIAGLTSLASTTLISGTANAANSISIASGNITFEGSSADGNETILTAANATGSDKTLTLPNETGTILTTASSVANSNLANSAVTIGGTSVSLGATQGTFTGLTSLASTTLISGAANGANSITLASGNITFEGSTADSNEIILTAADASGSDKTITLPNATGTVALLSTLSVASGSGLTYNSGTGEFSTNAIPNSKLANSSVTVGSTAIALGNSSTTLAGLSSVTSTAIVTNDSGFRIRDNSDNTKQLAFECSGISGSTTRTLTVPDANDTLVVLAAAQTLTNKTIALGDNTVTGALANGITATTQGASDNTTKVATTAYVTTAINNLINGAPAALNTLNELAAAMNDDAAFSATVTNNLATKMPLAGGTFSGDVIFSGNGTDITFDKSADDFIFNDGAKAAFGTSSDLQIFHNGSQNIIGNTATQLRIITDALRFRSATGSETYGQANVNGGFELHHNNVKKFETTSSGASITGNITVSGTVDGRDVASDGSKLDGIESGATADQTASDIKTLLNSSGLVNAQIASNAAIAGSKINPSFGNQAVTSTNSITLDGSVGDTIIKASGAEIEFTRDASNNITCSGSSGSLNINTAGSTRMTIASNGQVDFEGNVDCNNGLDVTGAITSTGNITITNTAPIISLVDTNANDDFEIKVNAGNFAINDATNSANRFLIDSSGTVDISGNLDVGAGVDVTGNITVSGTVDGRDVASDGTKLDGIESGATADQSASEILTLIKTVDGSGSGLDADTLDGISSGSFVRSDADDTLNGQYTISDSADEKLKLSGSSSPYIRFQEGTTNKAYIQWNSSGYLFFVNSETGESLRIQSGSNGLKYGIDGTFYNVWHQANDGSGSGLDADTVDGIQASSFLRSDASDTMTGSLTIGDGSAQTELLIKKADNNVSDHLQFYNGTTRMGEIGVEDTTWLRINQETNKNIYTPRYIRADNGFFVDGTSKGINGSGNFIGGTIAGASDYSTLLRSDTADTASGDITFSGGAGAATIAANSDIRLVDGNWTGNTTSPKIQAHGNYLYIAGGSNGIIFRENGTDRCRVDADGHFRPHVDSTYDIGTNSIRWRNVYADTLYGDGSNLTGVAAGATGGGSDEVFYENSQTVTTSYTITNGKNAMATGPITINSGATVTVGSGENLVII